MVERPPRIPASADSLAAKLAADPTSLIGVVDAAMDGLSKAAAVLAAIGELNLGMGGHHSDVLFTLCDLGAAGVDKARAALRAVPLKLDHEIFAQVEDL